jgi:hypothetical protein
MTVGTPSIPPGGRRLSEHRQKKAERRHAVRAPACAYRGEAEEGEINGQHLDCQTDANRDWQRPAPHADAEATEAAATEAPRPIAGTPTHGYEVTREAAMAAFAKSWRRE